MYNSSEPELPAVCKKTRGVYKNPKCVCNSSEPELPAVCVAAWVYESSFLPELEAFVKSAQN